MICEVPSRFVKKQFLLARGPAAATHRLRSTAKGALQTSTKQMATAEVGKVPTTGREMDIAGAD